MSVLRKGFQRDCQNDTDRSLISNPTAPAWHIPVERPFAVSSRTGKVFVEFLPQRENEEEKERYGLDWRDVLPIGLHTETLACLSSTWAE